MQPLISIPYIDNRGRTPVDLVNSHRSSAIALVTAARRTFGAASEIASLAALPLGDRASKRWLQRTNNPYFSEITKVAEIVGLSGVYLLNVCFEWGCTSGVWFGAEGPVMRRVLDWPFPALGEHIVVAHQKGPAGDFLNVTWPGVSGIYQAIAPERFAAAINQAPMREYGGGFAGDWFRARIDTGRSDALPPAHLLRQVFETAPDYSSAKEVLCRTPLAVPAIFILAGIKDDEGCIIERTEAEFGLRPMTERRVCATNHFEGVVADHGRGWRARPIDSAGRLACANDLGDACGEFSWFAPPIANVNSRLAMTASPATGVLSVIGTEGVRPVTEIFRSCEPV
jgi:hypothetical protein